MRSRCAAVWGTAGGKGNANWRTSEPDGFGEEGGGWGGMGPMSVGVLSWEEVAEVALDIFGSRFCCLVTLRSYKAAFQLRDRVPTTKNKKENTALRPAVLVRVLFPAHEISRGYYPIDK